MDLLIDLSKKRRSLDPNEREVEERNSQANIMVVINDVISSSFSCLLLNSSLFSQEGMCYRVK